MFLNLLLSLVDNSKSYYSNIKSNNTIFVALNSINLLCRDAFIRQRRHNVLVCYHSKNNTIILKHSTRPPGNKHLYSTRAMKDLSDM